MIIILLFLLFLLLSLIIFVILRKKKQEKKKDDKKNDTKDDTEDTSSDEFDPSKLDEVDNNKYLSDGLLAKDATAEIFKEIGFSLGVTIGTYGGIALSKKVVLHKIG